MINRIIGAGFKKLEVTSFSHPKLLPQFADAVEVLRRIDRRLDDVWHRAWTIVNLTPCSAPVLTHKYAALNLAALLWLCRNVKPLSRFTRAGTGRVRKHECQPDPGLTFDGQ